VPWDKRNADVVGSIKKLLSFCFSKMSSMPSQSNEAITNAPHFRNLDLFQANLDVEEEEDL